MNASVAVAPALPAPSVTGPDPAAANSVAAAIPKARWEAPAFAGALLLTGILYVWNLAASGWANAFYSAAVQAGTQNWVAFFYGSSDAGNSITVDKPPASLWVMELSARIFGLSSWSILVPEALMGVATAAIILFTVRRRFGAAAALVSTGVFALTPVAALMFRFNNPDALLLLLLTASVAMTSRAIDRNRLRWLLLAGVAVGFGFLTKQLQAFLVLPVLAGLYAAFAGVPILKRLWHLLAALGAVIVSAGWWVAVVELVPASARPYIGGSQTNSFLELTFGYNGLGRLTGNETGSVTGGGGAAAAGGGGMWGSTGLFRLFENEIGGQISWLIPAALILCVGALVLIGRAPRRDPRRILIVAFASWLLVTMLAFSFMAGIFHAYYTVALAAPLAGLLGASGAVLFRHRERLWARVLLAVSAVITAAWAWVLLDRAGSWLPWLKVVVLIVSAAGALLVLIPPRSRILTASTLSALLVGALLAPAAYTIETVGAAHSGSIVTAGPTVQGGMGGFGGRGFAGGTPGGNGGFGGFGGGAPGGNGGFPGGQPGAATPRGTGAGGAGRGGMGGAGGLLEASTVGSAMKTLLTADASTYTWAAATIGSQTAAGYQLGTGVAVMPIGGFNGSDPSPTLAQFHAYVTAGRIHYFIAGGRMGGSNGGSDVSSRIQQWVEANFTAKTVDGVTVYDLTAQN
ncbi:Undecaprenyl phosphate-alpha-4-amino-4-deoxy-L-arabinose arabinosyl transferase [Microbacterium azadirachtae]|uniref:Undecaprenyl phosphate-alpha-4-amino-4-deoxy-L-arabinose arabinosyl transferase n=1 Tax=Microbacterium azadirachtae TaxID=582680 RepID=A0A0F0KI79_9MICO|nr:glycosyltransferase family 39 protein [Microbacterium azadirachtae]KJL19835.1 Undecaprenyl phosphate-alpha-4-amino-4-deoxy-L-arabinose arabinosyl transferase [Microbacterium azadirachtae]